MEADGMFNEDQGQPTKVLLPDPEKRQNGSDPARGQYNQSRLMDLQLIHNAEAAPKRADRSVEPEDEVNDTARLGNRVVLHLGLYPHGGGKVNVEHSPWHAEDSTSSLIGPNRQVLVAARQESGDARVNTRLSKDPQQSLKVCDGGEPDIENDVHAIPQLAGTKLRDNRDGGGAEGRDGDGGGATNSRTAGGNVAAEFMTKKRTMDEEADQDKTWEIDIRFFTLITIVSNDGPKDKKLEKVKYQTCPLAFASEWPPQYERRLRIPFGPERTRQTIFRDSAIPRAKVTQCTVVEPIFVPFK
ncbi:hypothetical protein HOY80DRAFT_1047846 [Tuber brumale]|nr:hypothetical protein HOY80DRAFT_1047846 [Tuber brumale]